MGKSERAEAVFQNFRGSDSSRANRAVLGSSGGSDLEFSGAQDAVGKNEIASRSLLAIGANIERDSWGKRCDMVDLDVSQRRSVRNDHGKRSEAFVEFPINVFENQVMNAVALARSGGAATSGWGVGNHQACCHVTNLRVAQGNIGDPAKRANIGHLVLGSQYDGKSVLAYATPTVFQNVALEQNA